MVTVNNGRAEFSFYRPTASEVHVVGDFNGWRDNAQPMEKGSDGHWRLALSLPAGEFRFRYRADGQWYTDYAAFGVEPTDEGMNSVLHVPVTRRTMRATA
jgi:1,4-alpha-glucan branching enzyme